MNVNRKLLAFLRKQYPVGTRIRLDSCLLYTSSVVNRDVTIKLSDKKLNFFGPAGCSCNRTARPKGPELNNL